MRIFLFLFFITIGMSVFFVATLSGIPLFLTILFMLLLVVITVGYDDTAILFFFGAREIEANNEDDFYTAALHEAYKLAVPKPKLYFYNGALERAFVLQRGSTISLVLSNELLRGCSKRELSAICFELLLQVKKKMASKRTRVLFVIGLISWILHSITEMLIKLIPFKEFHQSVNWFLHYSLQPWLEVIFSVLLGQKYFKKLKEILKDYPIENDQLSKVGARLRKPQEIYSLPSRKLLEFSSLNQRKHFKYILTLEILPHEWDLIFKTKV